MLVRRSLAAPPLVNSELVFASLVMLIQHVLCEADAISSQFYEIKAECERDRGSVHQYATAASERSNAEFVKVTPKELWVI